MNEDKLYTNTEELLTLIQERIQIMSKLIAHKKRNLLKAPQGKLHVASRGKYTSYYYRTDPKDLEGKYIKKEDRELAVKLAQRDYDNRAVEVMKCEEKELKELYNKLLMDRNLLEHSVQKRCQSMIATLIKNTEEYISQWEDKKYEGKSFDGIDTEYYTERGERVRSKSELLIANTLHSKGIPYRYEYPLWLEGIGTIYPDFTCLNVKTRKEIIWEHFGMMDNPEYAQSTMAKINSFHRLGYRMGTDFIFSMESSNNPLGTKILEWIINQYLH